MIENKVKRREIHRAKIIQGQIKGLVKAIEEEKYCIDVITQSLAVQKSLQSLNALVLENHLKTHAKHQLMKKDEESRTIAELLKIYNLSNR